MANVFPFRPYLYSAKAGDLNTLATQPYDKISPEMQKDYLAASPYNIVRIILGERFPTDNGEDNVYKRAAGYLERWTAEGILEQEKEECFYGYFQEFTIPGTEEKAVRKGFIGLCEVSPYSSGIVHRHEQTLSGPKADRRALLEHTKAHFGQIFVLYPDPEQQIDRMLDQAARGEPLGTVTDLYGVVHRIWRISDPNTTRLMQQAMADKKLVIADGHHRYETALAFSEAHPDLPGADRVMMTFVNIHSPGLKILATHRVVKELPSFTAEAFVRKAEAEFQVTRLPDATALESRFTGAADENIRIGVLADQGKAAFLLERTRKPGEMDVAVLHEEILDRLLGITPEAVREGALQYVRGTGPAMELVTSGQCPVAFLLEPASVEEMARISFAGGVMPQKSTDFYPKLLTGLAVYRMG